MNKKIINLLGIFISLMLFASCGSGTIQTRAVNETTIPSTTGSTSALTSNISTTIPKIAGDIQDEISKVTNFYYESLNQKNLKMYNGTVTDKLKFEESSDGWQYMLKTHLSEKDVKIDFSKAQIEGNRILIPVIHTVTMSEDYIPSDLEPGENVVQTEIYFEKNKEGKFVIAEWGQGSILKNKSNP